MNKIILDKDNVIVQITDAAEYVHVVGTGDETHWESCSEEIAKQDYEARSVAEGQIIDGGIRLITSKIIMPFNCGVSTIVETEVPAHVTIQEYKYENGAFLINTPVRIKNIKKELETLDAIINRATEDLYAATGTTAYANVQAAIDRKNVLRAELASLEA